MNPIIAPSILSADFSRLGQEIMAVEQAGADWIHVDVMDGHFVPNITLGPMVVEAARKATALPLDVHLMIDNPDEFIGEFAHAGADLISVHAETCPHLHRTVELIESSGCRPGVVLNPATPLSCLDWILDRLHFVLLMSVNPGFGGQSFIDASLDKILALRQTIVRHGLSTLIQVDGGVNAQTIGKIAAAGTDVFVAGSAIFKSPDYSQTISGMKAAAAEAAAPRYQEVRED
ncbi:MAG: ribulose-phosphate 3-epimerase [Desulfobacterales bacterium]|nr:ribulose-phosphate 3-epimerase [Desulfobacterales bacterium]